MGNGIRHPLHPFRVNGLGSLQVKNSGYATHAAPLTQSSEAVSHFIDITQSGDECVNRRARGDVSLILCRNQDSDRLLIAIEQPRLKRCELYACGGSGCDFIHAVETDDMAGCTLGFDPLRPAR